MTEIFSQFSLKCLLKYFFLQKFVDNLTKLLNCTYDCTYILKVPTTDSLVFFSEHISRTAILTQASVIICIYIFLVFFWYWFWWQMFFNNSIYTGSHGAAINFLIWSSSLSFFLWNFYLSTRFLCVLTLEQLAADCSRWQTRKFDERKQQT